MYTKDKLEACGVPVVQLDDVPTAELASRLKPHSLRGPPIFFLNAHGEGEDQNNILTYKLSSDKSPIRCLNGDELVRKISDLYPGARTWGGTCHADACKEKDCLFGAESSFDEKAPGNVPAWNDIVSFICDGYSGECRLWNTWDDNHDGVLSSRELEKFFKRNSKDGERVRRLMGTKREEVEQQFKRYENLCKTKMKGVAKVKVPVRHDWNLRAEVWDGTGRVYRILIPKGGLEEEATFSRGDVARGVDPKTVSEKTTWEFHLERLDWANDLDSVALVTKRLSEQHAKWPAVCGNSDGKIYKNCKIEDEKYSMEVSCSAKRDGYEGNPKERFQPQPRNFLLSSPRCKSKHQHSLINQLAAPNR